MKAFKKSIRLVLSLLLLLLFINCDDKSNGPKYFVKFSVNGETHTYTKGFNPDSAHTDENNFTGDAVMSSDYQETGSDHLYIIGLKALEDPSNSPNGDSVSIYLYSDNMPVVNTEVTDVNIYIHDLNISNSYITLSDESVTFSTIENPGGVCSGIFSGTFPTDSIGNDYYPDELEGETVSGTFRVVRVADGLL